MSGIPQWGAGTGNWGRWLLRPSLIQRALSPCTSLKICLHFHFPAENKEEHVIYNLFSRGCVPWLLKSKGKALSFIPTKGKYVLRPPCLVSSSHLPTHFPPAFPLLFQLCRNTSKSVLSPYTKCTAMPGLARVSSRKFQILHQMAERV